MLTPWQIDRVRRLLSEGTPQRQIHALTGIARGTIAAIAHNRRPDYEKIREIKLEEANIKPTGRPKRCLGCGHVVYLPCRVCRARRRKVISLMLKGRRLVPELQEPLELELEPDHRRRYEEVRARREILMRQDGSGGPCCSSSVALVG
jgi:hypothetical protein